MMKAQNKYIPLDKSWIIRMGVLDLLNGYSDIEDFLGRQKHLGEDLMALKGVCRDWPLKKVIDVGESGTLYRFLQFASWKYGLSKEFVKHRTLAQREFCDNPEIVNYPLKKLLELDNGTSQWASAAVLCANKEKIQKAPYKLVLTFDAVEHWKKQRASKKMWEARHDATIENQAKCFAEMLKGKKITFKPKQSEDYCFARAFDFITAKRGEELWPSLRGHESDRIKEMDVELKNYEDGHEIESKDHRVVQAIAMKSLAENKEVRFKDPDSVKKSWPEFWDFLYSLQEK